MSGDKIETIPRHDFTPNLECYAAMQKEMN